ncbi:MAG TPA: hypothetical protein PKE57_06280 [Cellvibrionaceae bacterium]|nr:hypothetical protein [Cellvibrionaceae bacterium]
MSLVGRISALAQRIGQEVRSKIAADHLGLARAWVSFGYANNQVSIKASFNVASVTRLAAGRYRVNFQNAFADANYCWIAFARSNTNTGSQRFALIRPSETKTAQQVEILCATSSAGLDDSTEINLVVYR